MNYSSCLTWQREWFYCQIEVLRVCNHILNVLNNREANSNYSGLTVSNGYMRMLWTYMLVQLVMVFTLPSSSSSLANANYSIHTPITCVLWLTEDTRSSDKLTDFGSNVCGCFLKKFQKPIFVRVHLMWLSCFTNCASKQPIYFK